MEQINFIHEIRILLTEIRKTADVQCPKKYKHEITIQDRVDEISALLDYVEDDLEDKK